MQLIIIFTIKDTGIVMANEPCHVFLQSAECVDNINTPNSWPLFSNNCCYIHITHTHTQKEFIDYIVLDSGYLFID